MSENFGECPHEPEAENCPECIMEAIEDEQAMREAFEFDNYERRMLNRLDAQRDGDFDERPYWT